MSLKLHLADMWEMISKENQRGSRCSSELQVNVFLNDAVSTA